MKMRGYGGGVQRLSFAGEVDVTIDGIRLPTSAKNVLVDIPRDCSKEREAMRRMGFGEPPVKK